MIEKPMLAATVKPEDLGKLRFPLWVTPKFDGIRCITRPDGVVSRNLKPIPNMYIQEWAKKLPYGLDGELMIEGQGVTFQQITSAVMSRDSEEGKKVRLFAFDRYHPIVGYRERVNMLAKLDLPHHVEVVHPHRCDGLDALEQLESNYLFAGFEGVILRDGTAPYKFGRSTLKSQGLLKFKRMVDDEGVVVGFEEKMHNDNEPTTNALGRTERSSHKANLRPAGVLGAIIVQDSQGRQFNIGTGFNDQQREHIWRNKRKYEGKLVTYSYQPVGEKELPRFPSFKGFREDI